LSLCEKWAYKGNKDFDATGSVGSKVVAGTRQAYKTRDIGKWRRACGSKVLVSGLNGELG